jgi:hypothetical protein
LFRLGIYRQDQYGKDDLRAALSRNRISLVLLRGALPATPEQIRLFEEVTAQLRLSSGVYRTTFRGRFREFNEFLNSKIAGQFGPAEPIRIEDWAASDCLTSCEWASSILPLFPAATLTASDLTLFLIEATLPNGSAYIIEANGEPLQYIDPPFVIRLNPPEPRIMLISSFLEKRARTRLQAFRESWRVPREWIDSDEMTALEQPPFVFRKIPLVHPEAAAMVQTSPRFAIRRHSVFEAAAELCDVIRTMNIFNLAYFSRERLLEGARAVAQSLNPGGVWIVGRTHEERPPAHNATLFVREGNGFRLLERWRAGAEVEDLVLTNLKP